MEKIITLDKGQSATVNIGTATELKISLKEGLQDYSLLVSGNGISQHLSMENITQPILVEADTIITLTLTEGDTNISYDFIVELEQRAPNR